MDEEKERDSRGTIARSVSFMFIVMLGKEKVEIPVQSGRSIRSQPEVIDEQGG